LNFIPERRTLDTLRPVFSKCAMQFKVIPQLSLISIQHGLCKSAEPLLSKRGNVYDFN